MEEEASASARPKTKPSPQPSKPQQKNPDFLTHLELYISKRDGIDKLLKITRYASKIIISTSPNPHPRLKSFESSIGTSRKAFRVLKFIQDINSYRAAKITTRQDQFLALVAYGGEGLYYFVEQFVWLTKTGLIDGKKYGSLLQKVSAWAEFVSYFGSVGIKVRDLKGLVEAERRLGMSIEIAVLRGELHEKEVVELRKLKVKVVMKKVSIVQDVADWLMALADIRDGRGALSNPVLLAFAGLLSGLISAHKNWVSC